MIVALTSFFMLLFGVGFANSVPGAGAKGAAKVEIVGGGLLATGLMLLGVGLHSTFG